MGGKLRKATGKADAASCRDGRQDGRNNRPIEVEVEEPLRAVQNAEDVTLLLDGLRVESLDGRHEEEVAVSRRFCFPTENARSPQASAVQIAAAVLAAAGVLLPGGAMALAPAGAREGGTPYYCYFGYGSNVFFTTRKAGPGRDARRAPRPRAGVRGGHLCASRCHRRCGPGRGERLPPPGRPRAAAIAGHRLRAPPATPTDRPENILPCCCF